MTSERNQVDPNLLCGSELSSKLPLVISCVLKGPDQTPGIPWFLFLLNWLCQFDQRNKIIRCSSALIIKPLLLVKAKPILFLLLRIFHVSIENWRRSKRCRNTFFFNTTDKELLYTLKKYMIMICTRCQYSKLNKRFIH